MSTFSSFGLPDRLTAVLDQLGIDTPTPIQALTLPDALAGRDVLGRGRTGSGKTFAFGLPTLSHLAEGAKAAAARPRALVLAPTRELAGQIESSLRPFADAVGLRTLAVFGGVSIERQRVALRRGVDLLIACPGRLEDLIQRRWCDLSAVDITVIDEADHMAELGFLPAVRRLLAATPASGQRLLFSATLDKAVDTLARQFLSDPMRHEVEPVAAPTVSDAVHHVLHVEREQRVDVLAELIRSAGRTVVFTRTKHGARAMTRRLAKHGLTVAELHGNLQQNARTRNLDAFHEGRATALIATDIAARGIHVDDVALVVHADPPAEHKAYLHRSGRTGRAGRSGIVVTLATDDQLADVRSLTRAAGLSPSLSRVAGSDRLDWPSLQTASPSSAASWPTASGSDGSQDRRQASRGQGSRGQSSRGQGSRGQGSRGQGPRDQTGEGASSRRRGSRGRSRQRAGESAQGGSTTPAATGQQSDRRSGPRGGGSRRAGQGSGGRPHSAARFSSGRR